LQNRRVVVTGVGLVTALGTGTEENWKALCEGRSGVTAITRFDTTLFTAKIAAEVKNFEPLNWFDKKDLKKMDSFIHYAVAAADYAMKQAGLTIAPESAERAGVFIGSGIGGFTVIEREHQAFLEGGPRKNISLLHSVQHHQSGSRSGLHPVWRAWAELGSIYGMLFRGARCRRCVSSHRAW